MEGCKCLVSDFKNTGSQKKRTSPSIWMGNASIQTQNCIAATFNSFYRFCLFSAASVANLGIASFFQTIPFVLNAKQYNGKYNFLKVFLREQHQALPAAKRML